MAVIRRPAGLRAGAGSPGLGRDPRTVDLAAMTAESTPVREKTAIPKNPGRRDLGMKATLLFPDREIVETLLRPADLHRLPDVLLASSSPTRSSDGPSPATSTPREAAEADPSVIESGHGSTIEHIVFTFGISGVSRTLSHQLVRHRAGVAFDQQSQRYVKFKGASTMLPTTAGRGRTRHLRERYEEQVDGALELYGDLVAAGIPGEDARFVFPNATRTNLVMTTNLRALIHMSGLRLCTMAQWEIRRLFQLIRHEIFAGQSRSSARSSPRSACRSATATSGATATSTARSGRTRTRCSAPGRRSRRRQAPPVATGRPRRADRSG